LWSKAYAVGEEKWLKRCSRWTFKIASIKEKLAMAGIKRMKIKNSNDISFAIRETP
jgi:hypothetical protein